MFLAFVLKQWRWLALGAAVLALVALGWRVHAWHEAYKALPEVQDALAAEVACGKGSECEKRVVALQARAAQESATVIEGLTNEIREISNRPARTVRLRCTASDRDVSGSSAPGSTTEGPAGSGEFSAEAGRPVDVEALYRLARDADEQVALRRALIQWNKALADVK